MKKVVLMGDLHCGHAAGLTPPEWMIRKEKSPKLFAMETEMWDRYSELVEKYSPVDLVIVNGDLIEGKGVKTGGTELIETDLLKQVEMCVGALSVWDTESFLMTYGTPYHTMTGSGEDVEKLVAQSMEASINGHLFVEVDGLVLDCKHKIGHSAVPWSRHTAVSRERVQNMLWNECSESQPKANLFIRSHVHYFNFCGGAGWLGMTLPALQGAATKFGRQCSGVVDWGMVVLEIEDGKLLSWTPEIVTIDSAKAELIKI